MWLHEALAEELLALGGERLFGVLGDGNLFIVDAQAGHLHGHGERGGRRPGG